jgi:hypothetical protein
VVTICDHFGEKGGTTQDKDKIQNVKFAYPHRPDTHNSGFAMAYGLKDHHGLYACDEQASMAVSVRWTDIVSK